MDSSSNSGNAQRTYTAEQAAAILGVSVRTIYKMCEKAQGFKVIRVGKKCLRIHKESFDAWLDDCERPP